MFRATVLLYASLAYSFAHAQSTGLGCNPQKSVVAVDVGHSIVKPGATSARGKPEYLFNLDMARVLLLELRERGYKNSFLIGDGGDIAELTQRTSIAQINNADLFISVHHDSVQPHYLRRWKYNGRTALYSDKFNGYSIFYSELNGNPRKSMTIAEEVGRSFRTLGMTPTAHHAEPIKGESRIFSNPELGVYRFDELIVLRTSSMPAILVEFGIIVNRHEELHLGDQKWQIKAGNAVVDAVDRYFYRIECEKSFAEIVQ